MTEDAGHSFHSLICRPAAGGAGAKGPRRRPVFIAHPVVWWKPEVTAEHLRACRTGRDANGAWKPWDQLDEGERWAFFWEGGWKPG